MSESIEEEILTYFNFYDLIVEVSAPRFLTELLRKDFSHFLCEQQENIFLKLSCFHKEIPMLLIPAGKPIWQSKNSKTYEVDGVRFNDYYGELLSVYSYEDESCSLWSEDKSRLHEIAYLVILSRVGKKLDLMGLHKIHAFSAGLGDVACVGMMDMGVGKSTLLSELLCDERVTIFSDDTPLIDEKGNLHPFAIRLGASENSKLVVTNPEKNKYELERKEYGLKKLICLNGLKNAIGNNPKKVILFSGVRTTGESSFKKMGKLKTLSLLFKHMVIGIGLPMILEYFWETGSADFFRKTKIFFKRLKSSASLAMKCKTYEFKMNPDVEKNAKMLIEILEREGKK